MSGHVRLHRSLLGHPAFRDDAEAMAFAWMIMKAAWRPVRVRYKGWPVYLKRGELCVSQRDMAASLDRDKGWIERLWKRLTKEAMVKARREAAATVITICNYDAYQLAGDDAKALNGAVHTPTKKAGARQGQGTEQVSEEGKKSIPFSEENGSDPKKEFWANAKAYLGANRASLIGRWVRDYGEEETAQAIAAAQIAAPVDPVSYIGGILRGSGELPRNHPQWQPI